MRIHGWNGRFYACQNHETTCILKRAAEGASLEPIAWPHTRPPLACSPLVDHTAEGAAVAVQVSSSTRLSTTPVSAGVVARLLQRNLPLKAGEVFVERELPDVPFGFAYPERERLCALYNDGCTEPTTLSPSARRWRPWYPNAPPAEASSRVAEVGPEVAIAPQGAFRALWNRSTDAWDIYPSCSGPYVVISHELSPDCGTLALQLDFSPSGAPTLPPPGELADRVWFSRTDLPGASEAGFVAAAALAVRPALVRAVAAQSRFRPGAPRAGAWCLWAWGTRPGRLLPDGTLAIAFHLGVPVKSVRPAGPLYEFTHIGWDWALSK